VPFSGGLVVHMPLEDIEPYLLSLLNLDRLGSDEQLVDYLCHAVSRCRLKVNTETRSAQRARQVEEAGVIPAIAKILVTSQLPPAPTSKAEQRRQANQT
jgi:hypothetical protein